MASCRVSRWLAPRGSTTRTTRPTDAEPPGSTASRASPGRSSWPRTASRSQDLAILQAYTAAAVKGRFYLRDRTADLTGMVRFDHPDLDGPSLRPILRMAGTLDALETHISDAQSEDVQKMEAAMLEIIRKVEAERRGGSAEPARRVYWLRLRGGGGRSQYEARPPSERCL